MNNIEAIQFNGWNYGAIEDWFYKTKGIYMADFKESFELNGRIVHRNDWVVKNSDGVFEIISNLEFQDKLSKEYD